MKESIFRLSNIQHHNDDDLVKTSRTGRTEKTKLSLRHIRKIHQIKSEGLGHCYSVLGDSAWQILCEIHLYNLDHAKINIAKIRQSMALSNSVAKRYLEILQMEFFVKKLTTIDNQNFRAFI